MVIIGLVVMAGFMHHVSATGSRQYEPQTVAPVAVQTRQSPPEQVAGVQTAITAPEGVAVTVNNAPVRTQPTPHPKSAKPAPAAPVQSNPSSPVTAAPVPETVIVNLKTPMEYALRPGERSPQLEHLMTDGVRYEWMPGKATIWQDETPAADAAVWQTIALDKPAGPYISDRLPFVLEAAADAKPGFYEVKIIVRIHEHATMGVPIAIRITE